LKGQIKMKKQIILTCVLLVAALTIYAQQNPTLHQRVAEDLIRKSPRDLRIQIAQTR